MQIKKIKVFYKFGIPIFFLNLASSVLAEDNIIQQEKMSYERCLEVITTSATRLSISPKISDVSNQKRVAVFILSDGTLSITCDGEKDLVTVTTNMD